MENSEKQVRVIFNRSRIEHYAKDPNFEEMIVKSTDLTSELLRELYNDPLISEYRFTRDIQKKDHSYNKENETLYFYILKR
jgi:hypothetical protein